MTVSASRIFRMLIIATLALVGMHVLGLISRFAFERDYLMGLIPLFNLEAEANIPTLFSCVLLLGAALACLLNRTGAHTRGNRWLWLGLALIFLFMAVDEFAQLHEKTMLVSREFFGGTGYFYYAWVIPFGALALFVGIVYLRFLSALPRKTALLFITAGTMFVGGAIGFELLEAPISERGAYQSMAYMALVTVEELLEMSSICLFIYAALDHAAAAAPTLSFRR
jgi:hypothetical protein